VHINKAYINTNHTATHTSILDNTNGQLHAPVDLPLATTENWTGSRSLQVTVHNTTGKLQYCLSSDSSHNRYLRNFTHIINTDNKITVNKVSTNKED